MLWPLLGVVCVIYLTAELVLAHSRRLPLLSFGAVDASSGRCVELTVDRRTRFDPELARRRRRSDDR